MTNGMLLGKFMPLTKGHQYLIDFARNHCEKLIVIVGTDPNEPIDGTLRAEWVRKTFPDVIVKHVDMAGLPQSPETYLAGVEAFEKFWGDLAIHAADGMKIDYFYASEEYGEWMAEYLDAEFIPVDLRREAINISATEVRECPFINWNYMAPVVRQHYTKKIVLMGPESVGKSTSAKTLAKDFETVHVPEYGRTYCDWLPKFYNWHDKDFQNIIDGHQASLKALLPNANRIIIEDTDPLMTAVWCEKLTGSAWLGYGKPLPLGDYYLLFDPTVPFMDDGTRIFPRDKDRWEMFEMCKNYLERYKVKYDIITGNNYAFRGLTAWKHVNNFITEMCLKFELT